MNEPVAPLRLSAASAAQWLLLTLLFHATGAAAQRPNIVFLFSDDHAAHALSAYRAHLSYGAELPPTPHLDRLAASGVLFTQSFVTNSICGPSRATVLTGQYGHLNGVMTNVEALHPTATTFPRLLREAGYTTGLFGKWHLKSEPVGFDHFEVLAGQGPYYNPTLLSARDTVRHQGYTNDVITERAMEWLGERSGDRPFLMMLHFNAPHRFWDPGPEQLGLFRDTVFAEPPTFWDTGEGRAFRTRDAEMTLELDLFDRDLKLVAPENLTTEQAAAWEAAYGAENARFRALGLDGSDQGFFLGDRGWFDKRWMYEESLRTPLLVRWPGVVEPGGVDDHLIMNLDLAQTFLEIGGAPTPAGMQGRSIVPLLRGEAPANWRDAIYYQYFAYPDWHMVHRQYGVRTRSHKLIHFYEVDRWELFDLERDPLELRSVHDSPEYREVRERLTVRLGELRREFGAPETDPVPHRPFVAPEGLRRPEHLRPAPPHLH